MPFGFTPRQFLSILKDCEGYFVDFTPGEYITEIGSEMNYLHLVVKGVAQLRNHEGEVIEEIENRWIGELYDPNREEDYWNKSHKWAIGHKAITNVRALRLDRRKFDEVIKEGGMQSAADHAVVKDLWRKLFGIIQHNTDEKRLLVYKETMRMAAIDNEISPVEKDLLLQYRKAREITDLEHLQVLKELNWTEEEFENCQKKNAPLFFQSSIDWKEAVSCCGLKPLAPVSHTTMVAVAGTATATATHHPSSEHHC